MPAARHCSRSPCSAFAVSATIGTRRPPRLALPDRARGPVPVHLGHLAVQEDEVVGQARRTASTASRPLPATSTRHPGVSSIRITTRWLTALSSATSTRQPAQGARRRGGARAVPPPRGAVAVVGSRDPRAGRAGLSTSRSRVGRTGLIRYAVDAGGAGGPGRRPAGRGGQHQQPDGAEPDPRRSARELEPVHLRHLQVEKPTS